MTGPHHLGCQIDEFAPQCRGVAVDGQDVLKIDRLHERLTDVMKQRMDLKGVEAQTRMRLIQLDAQITQLRYSARNLQAVVTSENPASGPEGGIYRVTV